MKYWTNSLVKLFLISSFLLSTSYAKGPETATQFLPPDEAFIPSVEQIEDKHIRVSWKIADRYYLYVGMFEFSVDNDNAIEKVIMPDGVKKQDEFFGDVDVFYNQAIADIFLKTSSRDIKLKIKYQGCAEAGLCYPPIEKKYNLKLDAISENYFKKVSGNNDQISISNNLANQSLFLNIILFFLAGILLAFTPCVFPMIPILTGIIVGQGNNLSTQRAFAMSLTYVIAMSVTYALIGMLVASSGINIQANLQNPYVLISFALLFFIFALAMFDFVRIQMPTVIQNFLVNKSNAGNSGTFFGVGIMGSLSALIVGPCVTAPLIGALIYISTTGDYVIGGMVLFSLGLGMGTPLLVLGTSASRVLKSIGKYLPLINKIFGLLFLVVAIWLLERILSEQSSAFLWTALSLATLIYLNTSNNLKSIMKPLISKLVSLILIIYSGLQFYGISSHSSYNPTTSFIENKSNIVFTKVYDTKNLYENINNVENITMIDLYADWCVACKELEKYTFTDPRVEKILSKINLIKYDITKTSEDSTAFLSKHKLFGPPAILFYENNGIEMKNARIVGFVDAETFLNKIDDIVKKL